MKLLVDYAMQFVGTPYKWGGATPMGGLDCSGLVQIILRAAGEDPQGDQTAQGLYNHFRTNGMVGRIETGSIAFYGKSTETITHVAFCLDRYRIIEAAGGGSKTFSIQDAIDSEAFVKISHIDHRKDFLLAIKPYYKRIG